MDNASYVALLAEVTKNLTGIVASEHPDTSKLLNDVFKLFSKINTQSRQLSRKAATDKVIGKGAK